MLSMLVAAMALAACGVPEEPSRATEETAGRSVPTDCGTFSLSQGDSVPTSAVECLIEAVHARRPARLTVTSPSVEGDPIPVTYIAGADDGRVEVITDLRQDRFSDGGRTRMICTEPILAPARPTVTFARCAD
jgi:hypothetical protein